MRWRIYKRRHPDNVIVYVADKNIEICIAHLSMSSSCILEIFENKGGFLHEPVV